ncbi:TPA: hypothetical protein R0E88_005314 [Klebsiella pneumoniae]|uniref:hypothetical protein n=1 Tax=Klebsiella pneumoniae TaxID=573 RepID=UPI001C7D1D2E|nr:hypothetical protein [Klebsiella pneumoniae]MCA5536555.1 hypothetical protein [Klebsiella pneumoniae]MCQ8285281.1 hypothetical protein [Klebsiella pneumoniae]MEB2425559.1 hypothetical protein [Klebsiella pneumoniae]HBY3990539.1 hypothetical protein [Klebsiella pneumoniae]HDZ9453178.1 hypothetical protein [Klebsiella pneumoniae]
MTNNHFSREELLSIIETDYLQYGEASMLARIALAAMDSDPVAYMHDGEDGTEYNGHNEFSGGGKGIPLYRHAQQPVVPATLPCSVELKPGLIIGKGCKTETLLTALRRRADYYAELDAMTPEERAERDANIAAFKTMLPQPAPVVPEKCPAEIRDLISSHTDALFNDDDAQEIWNACRAAMLAAAPQEVK